VTGNSRGDGPGQQPSAKRRRDPHFAAGAKGRSRDEAAGHDLVFLALLVVSAGYSAFEIVSNFLGT
jgi:hypothetical protein